MPMQPVRCHECSALVRVRKRNNQHTAVQWDGDGVRRCKWFQAAEAAGETSRAGTLSCYALTESIEDAVHDGRVEVPSCDDARGFAGIGSLDEALGVSPQG